MVSFYGSYYDLGLPRPSDLIAKAQRRDPRPTAEHAQWPRHRQRKPMEPVRKRHWTADENERLKALVSEGVSLIKVAAALKRNRQCPHSGAQGWH